MTFVLDPLSIPAVLKEPRLSFGPVENDALVDGFGFTAPRRAVDLSELAHYDRTYLKGAHLAPVTARMEDRLGRELRATLGDGAVEVELYGLLWGLIFRAGTDSLFGDGVQDAALAEAFARFDAQFPLLIAKLPRFLTAQGRAALVELQAKLEGVGATGSTWMSKRAEHLDDIEAGVTGHLNSSLLWAATANTVPTAFWTLHYLLRDAEALAAVRAELEAVVGPPRAGELPALPAARLDELRLLDSAVREALRLATGTMTVREVVESFTFEAPCGRWGLREGDRVCVFPYLLHRDPEIHPEPERYRVDRFYSEVGVKRFEKGGQRLAFALMPFGGGHSMCPGRYFAINEMKLVVAMLLHACVIELVEPGGEPGFDLSRSGLGIYPPLRDVPVRVRLAEG